MTAVPGSLVPVDDDVPGMFVVAARGDGAYPNANAMLLLTGEGEGVMLDCGAGTRATRRVAKAVSVTRVYFSHWHEDHAVSWHVMKDATRLCHGDDVPALSSIDTLLERYAVKGTSLEAPFKAYMDSIGFTPVEGVRSFDVSAPIELPGGRHVDIIHAPGHTRGHCIFLEPASGVAFLGDIDLTRFGPWYGGTDSDLGALVATLEHLSTLRIQHAVTGHAPVQHGEAARAALQRYAAVIEARSERVLGLLSGTVPRTSAELAGKNVVYKQYGAFKEYLLLAETVMIGQHLALLERQGRARREAGGHVLA